MTRSLMIAAVLVFATSVASAQYHGHHRHAPSVWSNAHYGIGSNGNLYGQNRPMYQFQPTPYQYTPVYNYSWINTPWGGQATFRSNIPQPSFNAPAPFVPAFPMFPQNNGFNSNWSW